MIIQIRKCDACRTRHDSDKRQFFEFGKLVDDLGQELDICGTCIKSLLAPARGADVPAAA